MLCSDFCCFPYRNYPRAENILWTEKLPSPRIFPVSCLFQPQCYFPLSSIELLFCKGKTELFCLSLLILPLLSQAGNATTSIPLPPSPALWGNLCHLKSGAEGSTYYSSPRLNCLRSRCHSHTASGRAHSGCSCIGIGTAHRFARLTMRCNEGERKGQGKTTSVD